MLALEVLSFSIAHSLVTLPLMCTQVDKVDVTSATIANVDMHLNMLRGAITSFGGSVDVLEITDGVCKLKYKVRRQQFGCSWSAAESMMLLRSS